MKKLLLLLCATTLLTANDQNGTVNITVENIKSTDGRIAVALFNTAESFAGDGGYVEGIHIPSTIGKSSGTVSVPAGEYAIAVFHDKNVNDKLDKGMFGIPKEPYGASNNKYASFGRPVYELSLFTVTAGDTIEQTITLLK